MCQHRLSSPVRQDIITGVKLSAQGGSTHAGNFSLLIVEAKLINEYYLFNITGRL